MVSFSAARGVYVRTRVCYAEIFAESCGQHIIILFVCQAGDVYLRVLKSQVSSHASSMSSMFVHVPTLCA